MREHYHKTPPPVVRDGAPMPPKWMLLGAGLLAVDDVRVVSVEHVGKGTIAVRVVGANHGYDRYGSPDRKPGELPTPVKIGSEQGGVRFWMMPMTAREIIISVSSRVQPEHKDAPADHAEPASTEIDVTQVASFELAHIARTDKQYLFLRAFDAPYSLRLELEPANAARFAADLLDVLSKIHPDDQNEQIELINVPVETGKKAEVDTVTAFAPPARPAPAVQATRTEKAAPAPPRVATLLGAAASKLVGKVLSRFGI
jgi:hypothetical protein